jgi:uncharacterized metal-binding protein YceD (DUF177 family)
MVNFMDDVFKIYIEQLRESHEEKISEKLNPDFLEIHEPDLAFDKPVELEGVAYLAEQELVLHWEIRTEAILPCSICNEPVRVPLHIQNFYYAEPTSEIKSGIYNFKELLRETILLEVPAFAECTGGNCPKRKEYRKYLKEPSDQLSDEEEGYHPFADLDWKP